MSFVLRLLPLVLFGLSEIYASPVWFEQRTAVLFEARPGGEPATFRTDNFSIGPFTVWFTGSSPASRLEGVGKAAPATYFRARSRYTFSRFPELALRGLYPGVDAIFYDHEGRLEYDLVVAPHAATRRMRLRFEGARGLSIDGNGDLRVESDAGVLIQKRPRVFQSERQEVSANYILLSRNEVGFRLGRYDAGKPLKIDPELAYQRYFGGSGSDKATAVTTDAQGNIYVAGTSSSLDFPATTGLSPKPGFPLASVSSGDLTVHSVPVAEESSVTAISGTPDGQILYVATPDGIYESGDTGATWMLRGPLPPSQSALVPQPPTVQSITVDAIDPSRVFAATGLGLFFSSNSGQSWGLQEYGLPANANGGVVVTSTIVSAIDQLIVYAITGSPNGLFRSTDAGGTWHQLNLVYPGEPPVQSFSYPIAATLGPNGSDLYVLDGNGNLLKSVDGGASFQLLGGNLPVTSTILVDSTASTFYILDTLGVQKSTDGGHTFALLAGFASLPSSAQPVRQIALDPSSNTLYLGTSTLLYASTDGGATLQPLLPAPNLHALTALGGNAYAGFDTVSVPYVTKWDPTGSQLLYSTFLGGFTDSISGIKVDSQGRLIIAGTTYSQDFTVTSTLSNRSPSPLPSVFVMKLSADGTQMVYSDIIGASKGMFLEGLAIDSAGAPYLTGQTGSPDFPTTANSFQPALPAARCTRPQGNPFAITNTGTNAFVSKLSSDGSALVYSTFVTGSCGSAGQGITVDAAGEAVVVGYTTSPDFPASSNAYQPAYPGDPSQTSPPNALYAGFVTRLSAAGDKVVASSYLGGGFVTSANAVTVDAAGNVALTGYALNIAPGATPGAFQPMAANRCVPTINIGPGPPPYGSYDAFLLKLDPALSTPRFMTYLGGGCDDAGDGIALDAAGNTWVTGSTQSSDFPLRSPYQGRGITGRFVSELSADGTQLLFSTATDGVSLTLDSSGAPLLAGAGPQSTIPKKVQGIRGIGTAAELIRIDPATMPAVEIDAINPVTSYPPALIIPSNFGTGVVPGELVRITGHNLGPATLVNAQLDAFERLPFSLANSTVYFDTIPAPLISVQDSAIECFAPFEIRSTTKIAVEYNGGQSNTVLTGVAAADLQILGIANADGTPNSASHPASPGSVVVFYVSGLGETNPLSVDGLVNSLPLPVPLASVSVYVPGLLTQPQFVGAAPGMIAGIAQVNVQLPSSGSANSNMVSIGLNNANANVYVAQ